MPTELTSDEMRRLVAGLQSGRREALDQAFDSYRPRVFSLLVRMTKDSALAEDLTQEAFIRLARSAPKLLPDTRLDAWLMTVARNLALDHFRWRRMHRALTSDTSVGESFAKPETPFARVALSQTQRRVEQALGLLNDEERELLLSVGVSGSTPSELARTLGLSAGVVRKRLSRARARLLALLEQTA
ncbi:MAG: RNA polymerase sigma factor [Polyangiaceae bacterium]|nr:RNA polymerase sigma factor [Myxococcales bacterium]MCB9584109.1 RNA polymerase sigma factor [Polyangiaceae bacterium]